MLLSVLSGFALALLAPWIHRAAPRWSGWILAALPAGLTGYFILLLQRASAGIIETDSIPWVPDRGINLAFMADGLGALFALIIAAVGTLVIIYAGAYFRHHQMQGRFFAFILAFMASMLGVALSDNLLLLYVFWELTSLTSYLLIGFEHKDKGARSSALQALFVTSGGGVAMLAGFVLLGQVGGTYSISELSAQVDTLPQHDLYLPILLLVLAGAFTKSAQFPFHFWLPNAMAAPTPVSAYLHSATMVKAGVYLLARLSPLLGGTTPWLWILSITGGVTMLFGAWLALQQSDSKRLLAYATISVLGTLILLLGYGTHKALEAAMVMLVAHAGYKGTLFLVAGAIDHEVGTRDMTQLSGLGRHMPFTAATSIAAAISMLGLPPFLGFISKELLYEALLGSATFGAWLLGASVVAKALLVAAAIKVGIRPFVGQQRAPKDPHEASTSFLVGPVLLALLGVACGLATGPVSRSIGAAVQSIASGPVEVKLALWHGFNQTLALSLLTVATGTGLFFARQHLLAAAGPLRSLGSWGPERAYGFSLKALNTVARVQTRALQSGYLRVYVLLIVGTTVALTSVAFIRGADFQVVPSGTLDVRIHELSVAAIVLLGAMTATTAKSRLAAVAALAAVGYGVALLFVLFAAPDLAITQFSLETLALILFLVVVYRLPPLVQLASRMSRLRDALVAGAAGGLITLLVLSVTSAPNNSQVSGWLSDNSHPLAHGRNVVNVILVDFRALDTLGEITVLAVAAVGVFALMKLRLGDADNR